MNYLNKNWTTKLGNKAEAFDAQLEAMMDGVDDVLNLRFGDDGQPFGLWQKPEVTLKFGSKYCKIVHSGGSVAGFLTQDGDVLMAAGWNAPALNGARSNIFDSDAGVSGFNDMGTVRYKS